MIAVLATLSGVLLGAGVLVSVVGVQARPTAVSTGSSTGLWIRTRQWWSRRTPRQRRVWAAGLVAGLTAFALTRWAVWLVIVPVLVGVVPQLLGTPPNRDLLTLEALDRWVRLIGGSLPTGKSIPDAIRATARQVPDLLVGPVTLLVARLNDRWRTADALRAFADDLDSPDSDAVVAALMLSADRGGRGASATLHELAESVQDRIRALREVDAEREKPRIVVRQVTTITLVVIGAVAVINPGYFAPLAGPIGQVIVLGCLGIEIGALTLMRRRAAAAPRERILTSTGS